MDTNHTASVSSEGAVGGRGYSVYGLIPWVTVGFTITLMCMLMVAQQLVLRMRRNPRECLEEGIVKIVRRLGIREPSTTHRDSLRILSLRVNDDLVTRLLLMYEEGVYGGRNVDCDEYTRLLRKLLKSL